MAPGVEVTSAGLARREFPARVSEALGICLKIGPSHLVTADGRRLSYPADAVCVRPPGCVWSTTTEVNGFLSIDLPASFVPDAVAGRPMRFAPRRGLPDLPARIRAVLAAKSRLEADEVLVDLVARVVELGGLGVEPGPGAAPAQAVDRARELIAERLPGKLTLDEIAAAAGISKFSLVRAFRRTLGTTPHAYVVMLRLNHARALLADGRPVADAAARAGFADQSHLTRWFRRAHGVTPSAYARVSRR